MISIQNRQLTNLLPPSIMDAPENLAFELVRAVLVRSNYIPGIRHRLGWCGIHEVETRPGSITARINTRPGVFGLLPLDPLPGESGPGKPIPGREAKFSLGYFPSPQEETVERFSIEAGIQVLKPDFMDKVRKFCLYPELTALFHLGFIEARVEKNGIFLAVSANDRLGWTSKTGILLQGSQGPIQAVAPDGIDQNLPAREIAMDFFRVLAASLTYTLASSPTTLYAQQRTAKPLSAFSLKSCEHRLAIGYFTDADPPKEFDWEKETIEILWNPSRPIPKIYQDELWWTKDLTACTRPGGAANTARGIMNKPRFIVLTGFLGAGKTSFLDKFIQAQTTNNNFVAVVQNEIGQKSLDAKLLDTYAVTQMDEGCVCCSLAGNLRSALSDIMDRFQPDFIVLETTGLANPANILREIDDLEDILEFASITTIMDSLGGERALDRFEVARDQVRLADVILINKCDLCDTYSLERFKKQIRKLNPSADIHGVSHGDINPALLYGVNFRNPPKRPLFTSMGKDLATHEKDCIETRLIELESPIDEEFLIKAIDAGGEKILRVKGVAEFTNQPGPMVFQYAPGTCNISPLMTRDTHERFLVIIGQELDKILTGSSITQSFLPSVPS